MPCPAPLARFSPALLILPARIGHDHAQHGWNVVFRKAQRRSSVAGNRDPADFFGAANQARTYQLPRAYCSLRFFRTRRTKGRNVKITR